MNKKITYNLKNHYHKNYYLKTKISQLETWNHVVEIEHEESMVLMTLAQCMPSPPFFVYSIDLQSMSYTKKLKNLKP